MEEPEGCDGSFVGALIYPDIISLLFDFICMMRAGISIVLYFVLFLCVALHLGGLVVGEMLLLPVGHRPIHQSIISPLKRSLS